MSAVRTALYERLTSAPDVVDLLNEPDAVYHQVAPQRARLPYIVLQRQSGTPTWMFAGAYLQQDVWMVKAISLGASASTAEALAAAIDVTLTDAPLQIDGEEALAVYRESDIDYLETDGSDRFRHVGALYRVVTDHT